MTKSTNRIKTVKTKEQGVYVIGPAVATGTL